MALATRLKNAVKKGVAMQELVQQVTALVAHVRSFFASFLATPISLIFFSVSLTCGEKSSENNTYFQVNNFFFYTYFFSRSKVSF